MEYKNIIDKINEEIRLKANPDLNLLFSLFDSYFESHFCYTFSKNEVFSIAIKKIDYLYEYLFNKGYIFDFEDNACSFSQNNPYVYFTIKEYLFQDNIFKQKIKLSKYWYNNDRDINHIIHVCHFDSLNIENFNNLHSLNKKKIINTTINKFNNFPYLYSEHDVINFIDLLIQNNLHIYFILLLEYLPLKNKNIKNYVIHYLNDKMQLYAFNIKVLLEDYLEFDIVKEYILKRDSSEYLARCIMKKYKYKEDIDKDFLFLKRLTLKEDFVFYFIQFINNINYHYSFIISIDTFNDSFIKKNNLFHFNEKYFIYTIFKIFVESDFEENILSKIDNSIFNINKKDLNILKDIVINNKKSLNKFVKHRLLFDDLFFLKYNIENF